MEQKRKDSLPNIPENKETKEAAAEKSTEEKVKEKSEAIHKKENSRQKFQRVRLQLGLILLISIVGLAISKCQASRKVAAIQKKGGMETILNDFNKYKKVEGIDEISNEYLGVKEENETLFDFDKPIESTNTRKELKELKAEESIQEEQIAMLYQVASRAEKRVFKEELDNVFNVGDHSNFFKRQIDYAKLNIDLSVISGGIINVHRIYEGSHPHIKPKDRAEYIDFIRDNVQNAVASNDKNYKAIVFKSIEATTY